MTVGAVGVIINELKSGINFWVIAFGIIAFLFNPIIPVYLNDKEAWILIDVFSALLFIIKSFSITKLQQE